ncbi:MAG: Rrf2 family transcriptional regulator [Acidobacteriota bacterium]
MNFTLKTEYALRALQEVIKAGKGKAVNRKFISEKQNISENFLEKIFIDLKKNNILKSKMGPGGGFIITKEPEDISFWDIYTAVDLPGGTLDYCHPVIKKACNMEEDCQVKDIWFKFNLKLREAMEDITLADIT